MWVRATCWKVILIRSFGGGGGGIDSSSLRLFMLLTCVQTLPFVGFALRLTCSKLFQTCFRDVANISNRQIFVEHMRKVWFTLKREN